MLYGVPTGAENNHRADPGPKIGKFAKYILVFRFRRPAGSTIGVSTQTPTAQRKNANTYYTLYSEAGQKAAWAETR